jgi:hypothetical protein
MVPDCVSCRPAAPRRHFETGHAVILRQFPDTRALALRQPVRWRDPFPVLRDGGALIAPMPFDNAAAAEAAPVLQGMPQLNDREARHLRAASR